MLFIIGKPLDGKGSDGRQEAWPLTAVDHVAFIEGTQPTGDTSELQVYIKGNMKFQFKGLDARNMWNFIKKESLYLQQPGVR